MAYIRLQKGLSDDTIVKLFIHYKREKEETYRERIKNNPKLWMLCREYAESIKPCVLNQMKKQIVSSNKTRVVGC